MHFSKYWIHLIAVLLWLPQVASTQTLLFKSGFESATTLGPVTVNGPSGQFQSMTGTDASTGFTWPMNVYGASQAGLHLIPDSNSTDPLSSHFFNQLVTMTGHTGASTQALHMKDDGYTDPTACCHQDVLESNTFSTPIKTEYFRVWVQLPSNLPAKFAAAPGISFGMLWEWKTNNNARLQTTLNHPNGSGVMNWVMQNDCLGRSAACNNVDPNTGAVFTAPGAGNPWIWFNASQTALSVPVAPNWFLLEVYMVRSFGNDGRYYMAVNGVTLFDHRGPNYLYQNEEISNSYFMNLYGQPNPAEEWLDDIEIWDGIPPACSALPCGASGTGVTSPTPAAPTITSPKGAIGTVGVPFTYVSTADGGTVTSWAAGGLPPGLSINNSTGVISGTPSSAGNFSTTISPTGTAGRSFNQRKFLINGAATSAPTVSSLTATSSSINAGEWSQLQWTQSGATTLTLNPGNINVTGQDPFPVNPSTTTTYTLTATNSIGSASRQVTVTVIGTISRTLGPEPGIQFSNPPTTPFCQYGEYQRVPASAFGGNCVNFLKTYDIFPTLYGPTAPTQSIPASVVNQYAIKVIWTDGNTYNGFINLGSSTGMNLADVNYQNYYWGNYTQNVTVPNFQNKLGVTVTPSNPLYISGDAWFATYGVWGANVNGVSRGPVTWAPGYPQNATAWSLGLQAFFTAAKNLAPNIRVVPHLGSLDPVAWINFHTIFQDCPGLQKEHYPLGEPVQDANHRLQVYNQILAFYWFGNIAAPVFPNIATEPRTRMTQWGIDIDQTVSTQLHTAFATYALSRGTNSFFDLITTGNTTADPNLWLPTAQALGTVSSAGAPQVTFTAPNHAVGDGFNLITRQYPRGIVYYNMSGTVQHPVPPVGAKDWNGNPVTSVTLADGQGEVLLTGAAPPPLAQKSIIGGIVNGAIVQ